MKRATLDSIINLIDEAFKQSDSSYRCIETQWNQHDRVLRVFIDVDSTPSLSPSQESSSAHTPEAFGDSDSILDGRHSGVGMNDCVAATRLLRDLPGLDEQIKGAYNLEVSSPGIERPLRLKKDFDAFVGSQVEVRVTEQVNGKKKIVGKLIKVEGVNSENEEAKYGVLPEGDGELLEFDLAGLHSAHLVYDWASN